MKKTLILSGWIHFVVLKSSHMIADVQRIFSTKVLTETNENLENRYLIWYIEYVWSFLTNRLSTQFRVATFQLFAVPHQGHFFTLCALRRYLFKFCALIFQRKWQLCAMTTPMTLQGSTLPTYIVKCTFNCSYQLDNTLTADLKKKDCK
jgi:hypothetical protein